ncbi:hypothetical protein [Chryseobacterium jejuense]|uniref:hypothetical protein n=1 Tax=Chryseobacterium jejuense TaxID=445960 RepID=UPI001AE8E841|nr:hypothetical protein [Chryseobacterium jejuense]MBP2617187.1 hypothetical protein [Chryseobacterium jejuense]
MFQFILMLLGLVFPNNNTNTITSDNNQLITYSIVSPTYEDGGPVTGETGQTPPPRK